MTRLRPVARAQALRERLDALVETFDASTITPDPLELVLRYENDRDREVVALLAAAFAYGRADIVVANVGRVLGAMGASPSSWLLERTNDGRFDRLTTRLVFRDFTHRFHKVDDLVALLERLGLSLARHGSLGNLFRNVYDSADRDIGPSLARFVEALI
ncbi:MAG: DUF2400 family protein, partial [Thermoanaerobaculia bacterium]